ncbi:phosphorylase family protein [Methylomarinum vadi]|uniref:phosphorylase family protein n=1 Tax=Methylomarinum vadi TaxID=438855 RepID=UPI0004DEDAF6|nr:hypothetical protein [Methylomarinum vadi]
MITGIVVALPEELATLVSGKVEKGDVVALTPNTLIAFAGAGCENAGQASEALIRRGADQLISWGCAAALSPELKPGDLVVADAFLSPQRPAIPGDNEWAEHTKLTLTDKITVYIGKLVSTPTIVADSRDKQALYAHTAALAVDMESYALAAAADKAALPCLTIRTIADPADMSLPNAVCQALNDAGDIELPELISHVLKHPQEIPALIKLGLHFSAAKKTLKYTSQYLDKITEFYANKTEH